MQFVKIFITVCPFNYGLPMSFSFIYFFNIALQRDFDIIKLLKMSDNGYVVGILGHKQIIAIQIT